MKTENARPLLVVRGLHSYYGDSHVLQGVDLDVCEGEIVTLVGRNGMGKTTTLNSLMGIVRPRAGNVSLNGMALEGKKPYEIARAGIAIVPEGRQIFPSLTVTENLIAMRANRSGSPIPWTVERIFELFPALAGRRRALGTFLSGGEQQMLAIGRALMTNPRLLILDEATEGLAPLLRRTIWDCLAQLKALGQAALIVDRTSRALSAIADRLFVLEKGIVVWSGTSCEFQSDPGVRERHLGI